MSLTPEEIAQMDAIMGVESGSLSPDDISAMDSILAEEVGIPEPTTGQRIGAATLGAFDTMTLGIGDEALAYIRSKLNEGVSYEDALAQAISRQKSFEEAAPGAYLSGQVGGALLPALGTTGLAGRFATNAMRTAPLKTAAGLGALEGGLYGLGSGEGGAAERAKSAAEMGMYGAVGGVAGASLAKPIGRAGAYLKERAQSIFGGKPRTVMATQAPQDIIEQVATRQSEEVPIDASAKAISKVKSALQEDLGGDFEAVMDAYKKGNVSLTELYGSRSTSLAKGAAQYPKGQAAAEKFFEGKTSGSYERVLDKLKNNVTDLDAYFTSADDIFNAGRAKAGKFYDEAYRGVAEVDFAPEVTQAIKRAKRQFPSELADLPDNSVKVLDYAKRVIDDEIDVAKRAGRGNFARSRTAIKNNLLAQIDEQVPSYKKAREISGDYLSIQSAIDDGMSALRKAPDEVAATFKALSGPEKTAYRNGLGKAIRDEVAKVSEGANPYKRVLGSPEKKKRIASVLSPKQFEALDKSLRAEDRLFKMRNEVLGGSPTASKLEAKNMIGSAIEGADNVMQLPRTTIKGILRKSVDGLNDDTAGKVAEILFETNPEKKLEILQALGRSKEFTPVEQKIIKETYFSVMPKFDVTRATGAGVGGITAANITTDNQASE